MKHIKRDTPVSTKILYIAAGSVDKRISKTSEKFLAFDLQGQVGTIALHITLKR